MTEEINILLKRVEKLEKGNLKLKVIVILVLCAVLAMFLIGAAKWNKEIVTERLKIVDEKGDIQAAFGSTPEGPGIVFLDSDGNSRMEVSLFKGIPGLRFLDSKGNVIHSIP